ncbi:MAG: AAA family ATPase [Solirubrobacterales bacterium]
MGSPAEPTRPVAARHREELPIFSSAMPMYSAREDLLERAEQLSALTGVLTQVAAESRGRLTFVSGEAGVGKTVLLRRFCDRQRRSARVLWGACDALLTPGPLGPFHDVAAEIGGDLPLLVSQGARPHDVVAAVVGSMGTGQPSVLVLEDLHWADEATLDVVRLLARRIEGVPLLVLATYRSDELDRSHPLRLVLGELTTFKAVTRLRVPPFSEAAVFGLAENHGVDGRDLYAKTSGNPFFVSEVLASPEAGIPDTVRDAVLARAARLDPPTRKLLEAAAVSPTDTPLWLLEGLAPEEWDHLEEGLGSGILVARQDSVAFRHELGRLTIEETTPPDRRIDLHRRALAMLRTPPHGKPDLARIAYHAEAAGDTAAVLEFAPLAAERAAALGAHREAASQYARALRYAGRLRSQCSRVSSNGAPASAS